LTSVGGVPYTYDDNGSLTNDGMYTYTWNVAGRHIAAAAAALPPDVVAAAQERGRAGDLWATVQELLAQLGSDLVVLAETDLRH
jgi:hypothetical protein